MNPDNSSAASPGQTNSNISAVNESIQQPASQSQATPPQQTQESQPLNPPSNPQNTLNQPTPPEKKDWTQMYTMKTATTFLVVSIVSLFIIPYMAFAAISMASLGIYSGIKNKLGARHLIVNILTIIISFASLILNELARKLT